MVQGLNKDCLICKHCGQIWNRETYTDEAGSRDTRLVKSFISEKSSSSASPAMVFQSSSQDKFPQRTELDHEQNWLGDQMSGSYLKNNCFLCCKPFYGNQHRVICRRCAVKNSAKARHGQARDLGADWWFKSNQTLGSEDTPSVTPVKWEDFNATGLLWLANTLLQTFGWAILQKQDETGHIVSVFPARVKSTASDYAFNTGLKMISTYLAEETRDSALR
jgi:hypothetical protein